MVGPVMVLALTTPAPPFAEEGSYYQGSRAPVRTKTAPLLS